jgi:DNA-binding transcriptional LysR family regulator
MQILAAQGVFMVRVDRYRLERWDDMQFVLAVAKSGSFHAAAEELSINQSTASRRIRTLQRRLGVKLFDRHAHGMTLTPAGSSLLERAQDMANAARAIERHLAGEDQRMIGSVHISAPDGLGVNWLVPALADFRGHHPGIQIELSASAGPVDLLLREADIAIRYYRPRDGRVVTRKVGHIHFSLFAAPAYVSAHGQPSTMDELADHEFVEHSASQFTRGFEAWPKLFRSHPKVVFRANTSGTFLSAVRAGFGIGVLPNYYNFLAPDLTRLALKANCGADVWVLCHEETSGSARVRIAIDFLAQRFRRDRERWFS